MAEILPGVHLIDGIDPSPDFSTHVYLVKDKGASWTLIDTGLPGAHEKVEAYLSKIHVEPHAVKKILLTHLHRDHTGSLKHMAKVTGARTFAHWIEAAYIAEKPKYDGPGSPPAEPFRVDEVLKDGLHEFLVATAAALDLISEDVVNTTMFYPAESTQEEQQLQQQQ